MAAVVLIGSVISIPLINNHTAYKVEKSLCEIPLPEETELIESLSHVGHGVLVDEHRVVEAGAGVGELGDDRP